MAEDKKKPAPETEAPAEEAAEGEDGEAEQPKKNKKLLLMIIIAVLFIGGAGAGGFFFLSSKEKTTTAGEDASAPVTAEPAKPAQAFYVDLPDITVNLASSGGAARFLRIKTTLEVASPTDVAELEKIKPRIIDDFQVYLRELRPDDLRGSAGAYRLRHDLLLRANQAAQPVHVHNVLFRELIVQ